MFDKPADGVSVISSIYENGADIKLPHDCSDVVQLVGIIVHTADVSSTYVAARCSSISTSWHFANHLEPPLQLVDLALATVAGFPNDGRKGGTKPVHFQPTLKMWGLRIPPL